VSFRTRVERANHSATTPPNVYKIDISYGQEYELVSGFIKIPRLLDRLGS